MSDAEWTKEDREDVEIIGRMAEDQMWVLLRERFEEFSQQGCTQQDLANRIGRTNQQVSRWLAGPTNITIRNAAKLLAAMDADICLDYAAWAGDRAHNQYNYVLETLKSCRLVVSSPKDFLSNRLVQQLDNPTQTVASSKVELVEFADAS